MADPLSQASAWTDEELDWIESHGGYVYEKTRDAVDDDSDRENARNAVLMGDVGGYVLQGIDNERARNDGVWDDIWDWFSSGINKVGDTLVDAYDYSRDWIDQRINRIKWGDVQLIGDFASTVDTDIDKEDWLNAVLIGDIGGYLDQDIEDTADRAWWDNLAIDFPEFSLDPLAGILGRLVDNIADRISGFIADALGIE